MIGSRYLGREGQSRPGTGTARLLEAAAFIHPETRRREMAQTQCSRRGVTATMAATADLRAVHADITGAPPRGPDVAVLVPS